MRTEKEIREMIGHIWQMYLNDFSMGDKCRYFATINYLKWVLGEINIAVDNGKETYYENNIID